MKIKDITVAADMAEVRGGNTIANTFIGGNANSTVSLGGVKALHSPISVGVSTIAANEVHQGGEILDLDVFKKSWSVSDSMYVGVGRFRGLSS